MRIVELLLKNMKNINCHILIKFKQTWSRQEVKHYKIH